MDKIYISIISTLIIIIISISIYILIKTGFYNSIIKELQSENKYLLSQISSAESLIDFQNAMYEQQEQLQSQYDEQQSRLQQQSTDETK